jgi:hypothetical protein
MSYKYLILLWALLFLSPYQLKVLNDERRYNRNSTYVLGFNESVLSIINDVNDTVEPIMYFPNMLIPINATDFQKFTIISLNSLYNKDAMNVFINNSLNKVNVLEKLITSKSIVTIERGENNSFISIKNKVKFNPNVGIIFRLTDTAKIYPSDLNASEIPTDLGRNSPMSLLAHELYHAYNSQFDKEYSKRKNDRSTKNASHVSFPNKEEEYVTLHLQNQTNDILGEDRRVNYGKSYYETVNPISTFPKNPTPPHRYERIYR